MKLKFLKNLLYLTVLSHRRVQSQATHSSAFSVNVAVPLKQVANGNEDYAFLVYVMLFILRLFYPALTLKISKATIFKNISALKRHYIHDSLYENLVSDFYETDKTFPNYDSDNTFVQIKNPGPTCIKSLHYP